MSRRFVIVNDTGDFIRCNGVYDSFADALQEVTFSIMEDTEGSEQKATVTPMYELEAETGFGFTVKHDYEEHWYILFCDEKEVTADGHGKV